MSDTMNYRFKHTAKHQNREVTEIEVRAPTMRDLKAIDAVKGDVAKLAKTIEVLTGMTAREIDDLHYDDVRGLGDAVADFFVICSGNSDKQLDAISDSIDAEVFKKFQENPWHTEGKNNKEWMLLDYINVVAHVFRKDRREYYALERLWGDADITEVDSGKN